MEENDPLKAQKRLFGTIKKIADKTETFFGVDDDLQNTERKNPDPAYKYIKAKSSYKKENMSKLICSKCGFQLNNKEDFFCPQCGTKVIYPTNEVDKENIEISNSTKVSEYQKSLTNDKTTKNNEEKIVPENKKSDKEESSISNEEKKDIITSHNNLPIDILIDLKSFFEDKLINEKEYNHLRKLALSIAKESQSKEGLEKIKSISREKLTELRNLFNEELIDKDEYDDLRKNLIEIE